MYRESPEMVGCTHTYLEVLKADQAKMAAQASMMPTKPKKRRKRVEEDTGLHIEERPHQ
jgi:hypothetical protein